MVTALFAKECRSAATRRPFDADITGPSIPRLFGLKDPPSRIEAVSSLDKLKGHPGNEHESASRPCGRAGCMARSRAGGVVTSFGPMFFGRKSTICLSICRPEPATFL